MANFIQRVARDPVSGLTHLAGALLGVVALIYLLWITIPTGNARHIVGAAIFGTSLILLYASSALYHMLHVSPKALLVFRRIDHALIFTLIGGTYTPFCLITLKDSWGIWLLCIVWGIALVGFFLSIFWIHAPRWLTTALYLFMGWFIVFAFPALIRVLSPTGLAWLVAGGLCYSVGALIYGFKRPNPWPPHFGYHEIWHLFVLAGSACHFVSVLVVLEG